MAGVMLEGVVRGERLKEKEHKKIYIKMHILSSFSDNLFVPICRHNETSTAIAMSVLRFRRLTSVIRMSSLSLALRSTFFTSTFFHLPIC